MDEKSDEFKGMNPKGVNPKPMDPEVEFLINNIFGPSLFRSVYNYSFAHKTSLEWKSDQHIYLEFTPVNRQVNNQEIKEYETTTGSIDFSGDGIQIRFRITTPIDVEVIKTKKMIRGYEGRDFHETIKKAVVNRDSYLVDVLTVSPFIGAGERHQTLPKEEIHIGRIGKLIKEISETGLFDLEEHYAWETMPQHILESYVNNHIGTWDAVDVFLIESKNIGRKIF